MIRELVSDDPEVMTPWQKYVDDIAALWPAPDWSVQALWAERQICIDECQSPWTTGSIRAGITSSI